MSDRSSALFRCWRGSASARADESALAGDGLDGGRSSAPLASVSAWLARRDAVVFAGADISPAAGLGVPSERAARPVLTMAEGDEVGLGCGGSWLAVAARGPRPSAGCRCRPAVRD